MTCFVGGGFHCLLLESCCCLQSCCVVMEAGLLTYGWTGCWIGGGGAQLGRRSSWQRALRTEDSANMETKVEMCGNVEDVHKSICDMQLHICICIYGELGCTGFSI